MADVPGVEETRASTTAIRETAKWLITAFAAIGALLLAGSQLSRIGTLEPYRFWFSVCGVVLGLAGVIGVLEVAISIITPGQLTLSQLAEDPEVGGFVNENPELLKSKAQNVAELRDTYLGSVISRNRAWSLWYRFFTLGTRSYFSQANPFNSREFWLRTQRDIADGRAKELDAIVAQVLAVASYERLRRHFHASRRWLVAAAALVVAGILLFAWAANPPEVQKSTIQPKQVINIDLAALTKPSAVGLSSFQLLGVVGPFFTGKDDCLEVPVSSKLRCGSIDIAVQTIRNRTRPGTLTSLLVIGSADKFELHSALVRRFGTNSGLARARADWVIGQLAALNAVAADQTMIALTVGSSINDKWLTSAQSASDRTVQIWGFFSN